MSMKRQENKGKIAFEGTKISPTNNTKRLFKIFLNVPHESHCGQLEAMDARGYSLLARLSSSSERRNIRLTLIRGFEKKKQNTGMCEGKQNVICILDIDTWKDGTSVHAEKITFHSSERARPIVARHRRELTVME